MGCLIMTEQTWPIQFDEDAKPEDIALAVALDLRDEPDEIKLRLYKFLSGRVNSVDPGELTGFAQFLDAVEAGLVPRRYRGEEGYEFKPGTVDDLINDFHLDRPYYPIDRIIGCWAGTHCYLTGKPFITVAEEVDDE